MIYLVLLIGINLLDFNRFKNKNTSIHLNRELSLTNH